MRNIRRSVTYSIPTHHNAFYEESNFWNGTIYITANYRTNYLVRSQPPLQTNAYSILKLFISLTAGVNTLEIVNSNLFCIWKIICIEWMDSLVREWMDTWIIFILYQYLGNWFIVILIPTAKPHFLPIKKIRGYPKHD